jgi:hypothetical protein
LDLDVAIMSANQPRVAAVSDNSELGKKNRRARMPCVVRRVNFVLTAAHSQFCRQMSVSV